MGKSKISSFPSSFHTDSDSQYEKISWDCADVNIFTIATHVDAQLSEQTDQILAIAEWQTLSLKGQILRNCVNLYAEYALKYLGIPWYVHIVII